MTIPASIDLVCLSHLRWDFVYQRPQHLMTRYGRERRVFFVEEPVWSATRVATPASRSVAEGVTVVTPRLAEGADAVKEQRALLGRLFAEQGIVQPILWYYTPMALGFSDAIDASVIAYDCMDELTAFRGAPPELVTSEERLIRRADVVFTGGSSLYRAKRDRHPNVHEVPSSVDAEHFGRARAALDDAPDQRDLRRPRLGYFGVIDERMDLELVAGIADLRPDWDLVLLGPVVKIDPAGLPQRPNIHYLGMKSYEQLPHYLAHWDVGMMPFALNEATRFISPTKTPEYLAAGLPVVSTAIQDVVRPYGEAGLVRIASGPAHFVRNVESVMARESRSVAWKQRIDAHLRNMSWDRTWSRTAAALALAFDGRASSRAEMARHTA